MSTRLRRSATTNWNGTGRGWLGGSTLHEYDMVDNTVVRAIVLSRWRLAGMEGDDERSGTSWINWLLVRRGDRLRIFHQM